MRNKHNNRNGQNAIFSFFKRHKGITWTELKMDQRLQIQNKCQRIKYTEPVSLSQ